MSKEKSKYKVGDKVKVMLKENWHEPAKKAIEKLPDRVATIKKVTGPDSDSSYDYFLEEMSFGWMEHEIIGLVPIPEKFFELELIARFKLMDME